MITRRLLPYLLLVLVVALLNDNNTLLVQAQRSSSDRGHSTVAGSGAPGEGDIAIMQKEITWGMQEMQRYKTLRGEWPVRPMEKDEKVVDFRRDRTTEENGGMRGKKPQETAHSNYWNLLVSVF